MDSVCRPGCGKSLAFSHVAEILCLTDSQRSSLSSSSMPLSVSPKRQAPRKLLLLFRNTQRTKLRLFATGMLLESERKS